MRINDFRTHLTKLPQQLAPMLAAQSRASKFAILLAIDVLMVPITFLAVALIWHNAGIMTSQNVPYLIILMATAGGIGSYALGLYRVKLNTYEQYGTLRTAAYSVIVGLVGALASAFVFETALTAPFFMTFTTTLVILSVTVRLALRAMLVAVYSRGKSRLRVLIYGAGQTGVQLAAALMTDDALEPVAFVDDNKTLQKIVLAGLPVLSPLRIEKIVEELRIDRIVLAMPSNSRPRQLQLARHLKSLGCEVSALPSFASLVVEGPLQDSIRPLDPSEYLGRDGLDKDMSDAYDIYRDSVVMVTGAGGSIGSELTRQVLQCRPRKLVLFEVSEHALYQIDRELEELTSLDRNLEIVSVLGSITDRDHVLRTMKDHGVQSVLHAAAYKHVTMVEKNRLSGLHNNVIGTRIVTRAAVEAGVANFIFVSTDKAVHPTSVMGASKRLAELLVQDIATRSDTTRFGIVRFGNVLGSSGSVVPLFEEQIARGGPVTLSHTEVTRYFMTLGEAARLVLTVGSQAAEHGVQGGVFLLDMGVPVQIKHLARQMIDAAGFSVRDADNPEGDIEIQITGLRKGEKLHEELAMRGHVTTPTRHPKIMQVEETRLSEIEMAGALRTLGDALDQGDEHAAIDVLRRYVVVSETQSVFADDQPTIGPN